MYMHVCNDYYLNMFACIHRLEYEFNLVDPDMSMPLAGASYPLKLIVLNGSAQIGIVISVLLWRFQSLTHLYKVG